MQFRTNEVYNIFTEIYKTYKGKALLKKRIYRDAFIKNLYWTNEEHQMYDYSGIVCDCLKQYDRWKAGTYIFIRK